MRNCRRVWLRRRGRRGGAKREVRVHGGPLANQRRDLMQTLWRRRPCRNRYLTSIHGFGTARCFHARRVTSMLDAATLEAERQAAARGASVEIHLTLSARTRPQSHTLRSGKAHPVARRPSAMRLRRLRSLEHAVTPSAHAPGVSNFANKLRRSSSFGRRPANVSSLFPGPDWLRSRLERMHL